MTTRFFFLAILLPLLAAGAARPTRSLSSPAPGPSIEDLDFLEGAWFGTDGNAEWEAVYTGPLGGEVLSASKEIRGERVVTRDFERFHVRDGRLTLTPFPNGRQSLDFPLIELDAEERRAVFENAENDFPSRFTYHRVEDERLLIRLEGESGGKPLSIELDLERS